MEKQKNKTSEIKELKVEAVKVESFNEEIKEGAEESREESAKEKVLNGTPRFNKFNQ
jgi:hypothetical protein